MGEVGSRQPLAELYARHVLVFINECGHKPSPDASQVKKPRERGVQEVHWAGLGKLSSNRNCQAPCSSECQVSALKSIARQL